ncbi:MAG: hypothetical protein Q7K42_01890, partial [Candidatus Diapherotrites archaeon]|nr:hypothetical protein [Candidatus Diapherotrites archaeon]
DGALFSESLPANIDSKNYPDGEHELKYYADDKAGNMNNTTLSVIFDNTLPQIFITGIEEGKFYNTNINPGFQIVETNPDLNTFELNSQTYLPGTIISEEFEHNIKVTTTDKAGNTAEKDVNFIIDKTKPAIQISNPKQSDFIRQTFEVIGTEFDKYLNQTKLLLNNALISNSLPFTINSTNYPDGLHEIKYYANDKAGNENETNIQVEFDNTLPKIENITPGTGSNLRQIVTANASIIEKNLKQIQVFLDSNFLSSVLPFNLNTTQFEDGSHELKVTSEDKAGNASENSTQIIIDNTPPELSVNELTLNPTTQDMNYVIEGLTEALSTTNIKVNLETIPVNSSGYFNYSKNLLLGRNDFTIISTDLAGNETVWQKTRKIDEDSLPDFYEEQTLFTDPLKADTDGNGKNDDKEDFDNDKLTNLQEYYFETGPFSLDTDLDGLTDYFEVIKTETNPKEFDSDSTGSSDASKDLDSDNLTNFQEQLYDTNPLAEDSDEDTLSDYDEIFVHHTNPNSKDTDSDGLEDDS